MKNLYDDFPAVAFLMRLLSDRLPKTAELIYLFSETVDNQISVLTKGLALYKRGVARRIGIFGIGGGFGYPGHGAWEKELAHMGYRGELISIPSVSNSGQNTFVESQSLVHFLKESDATSAVVVAPAFHLPRAFISVVSVALRSYPALMVFPQVGEGLPWDEIAVHSQGIVEGARIKILDEELHRLELYRQKGDLIDWPEALSYLERRDQV